MPKDNIENKDQAKESQSKSKKSTYSKKKKNKKNILNGIAYVQSTFNNTIITILKRYDTYMETTKPVLNFYSKKPCFFKINGDVKIVEISGKIEQILSV